MVSRRVAVVSVGVVSPAGLDWPAFRRNIFEERDWFHPLPPGLPYTAGASVEDTFQELFSRHRGRAFKYRRYYNRATAMAVSAAWECLHTPRLAGFSWDDLAVFWGAGPHLDLSAAPGRGVDTADEDDSRLADSLSTDGSPESGKSPEGASTPTGTAAAWMLFYLPNLAASAISCALGSHGENLTLVTACAASSHALGEAFLRIRDGRASMVLCGGSDSRLNREGLLAYSMLGALSTAPNPKVLPFCRERNGFVPGEGAAAFLLMDADLAAARGIPILAEVAGYGATSDGFRLTDPEPTGREMERAMARALETAGVPPEDVDVVNAHGTGTALNDAAEAAAIGRLFGRAVPVTSNKSQFGHLSAASGAMECAASLAMIESGRLTPTVNTADKTVEPEIHLVRESRPADVRTILSNSFGFGGQNSALVLRRWEP